MIFLFFTIVYGFVRIFIAKNYRLPCAGITLLIDSWYDRIARPTCRGIRTTTLFIHRWRLHEIIVFVLRAIRTKMNYTRAFSRSRTKKYRTVDSVANPVLSVVQKVRSYKSNPIASNRPVSNWNVKASRRTARANKRFISRVHNADETDYANESLQRFAH